MKPNYEKETLEEVLTETESFIFENPISQHTPNEHLGVEKISLDDDFTRIDFVYIAPKQYINGGWVAMDSGCYIRPIGSEVRFKMIQAINIPIAPSKYLFKSCGEVHHFSLLFLIISSKLFHHVKPDELSYFFNLSYRNPLKTSTSLDAFYFLFRLYCTNVPCN